MQLKISISSQAEATIRARAAAEGQTVEALAARLVEESLRRRSIDEVLAPLRAEVEASGLDDDALSALLEKAKHEMRQERRSRRAS